MAITFAQDYYRNSAGIQWEIFGKLSLDNNYLTGGYSIDPTQFGLSQVTSFTVTGPSSGYEYLYNVNTNRLEVYEAPGGGGGIFNGILMGPHAHTYDYTAYSTAVNAFRIYYSGIVGGPFVVGETVTAGGGATFVVAGLSSTVLESASMPFILAGDTLTGGTSGAVATADSSACAVITPPTTPAIIRAATANYGASLDKFAFTPSVYSQMLASDGTNCSIRVALVLNQIEMSPSEVDGNVMANAWIDYEGSSTSANSAGIPAGNIMGGGSGGPLQEVANGTNLSTVTEVEFRVVGL